MKIHCQICKKEFIDYKSQKRKFCSLKCYWKSKLNIIPWNKGITGAQIAWNKGKQLLPLSKKHKNKISLALKGKMPKFIPNNKGIKRTKQFIQQMSKSRKGKSWTEARKKAQPPKKPVVINGKEYHPNWKEIRKEIYKRDNWQCGECGIKTTIILGKSRINCHHIDYNENNNNQNNLITLCASCHAKTNFKREDWINYFNNKRKDFLLWREN